MIEDRIILVACGGHGSVVLDSLFAAGVRVHGIIDPSSRGSLGVPVLGDDAWLDRVGPAGVLLVNGAGAIPGQTLRQRLYEERKARGFRFAEVRHPSAVTGIEVVLAEGSQLMAGCVIQCRARVGHNSVVNTRASVDHDCVIGAHVFIAPGVTLCGAVGVGSGAFIGAAAVVLPGVRIGAGAVVGAGSVVVEDVQPGCWVVGAPARPMQRKDGA
jgi:sugar O-acyltransferase (sialic acid O-acetyltransferase NeuD family)